MEFPHSSKTMFARILATAFLYSVGSSMLVLYPVILHGQGQGAWAAGLFSASILVSILVLAPHAGAFAGRHGLECVTFLGCLILAVSVGMLALESQSLPWVIAARIIQGSGHVLIITAAFAMLPSILPAERRAQGYAYFTVVMQLGISLGVLVGARLIFARPHSAYFLLSGLLSAGCFMPYCMGRWSTPAPAATPAEVSTPRAASSMKTALPFSLFIVANATFFGFVLQFAPLYFGNAAQANASISRGALLISAILGGSILTRLAFIKVFATHRVRRTFTAQLVVGLVPFFIPEISSDLLALAMGMAFGIPYGALQPVYTDMVLSRVDAKTRPRLAGQLLSLFEIGLRGGPLVMGALVTVAGYDAVFYACGVALVAMTGYGTYRLSLKGPSPVKSALP